ncbi:N-hydroxyarylamine O-acetyltransferase [Vibrio breoganii]|uniref:arylamine N-acetyltransferase family protein n=1 Tax=Vibrio breoganii TaxID=553239 RepID=UPI00080EDFE2|nr:arylamine N-acetyltransferase [Vibrio breoganii]OCH76316.1 N-hydroxyarylamine O-acetyltransferase [Vibrio breoganii]PMI15135.1 N-hydroxyarylamine O-acetyltransferase [Vibrio breoganii]PMO60643.1 N-hydroxyarylamine O-acetyltransferase [Vibrio breoganii]
MNSDTLSQYLSRIGLSKQPEVSVQGLKALHNAQHRAVPFENFDVIAGKKIATTADEIFNKVVTHQRGGYCFELNGLMLRVLSAIGFEAKALLGRVHLSGVPTGRGHQVSLVALDDQQWLVDAGFGSQTPRHPLPLKMNTELCTDLQTFRLVAHDLYGTMLQVKDQYDWLNLYSFDMEEVCAGDIEYGNHFTSTSPNSVFTSAGIASIATEEGTVTLLNDLLKIKKGEQITEIKLSNESDYFKQVKTHFGLELDMPYQKIAQYFDVK